MKTKVIETYPTPKTADEFKALIKTRHVQSLRFGYMLYSRHPQLGQQGQGGFDLHQQVYADHLHIWDSEGRMGYTNIPFAECTGAGLMNDQTTIVLEFQRSVTLKFA